MPIIKSAIKRARQSVVRRSRNLQVKRAIKQDVLALQTAVAENNDVQPKLAAAYSEIDRAVKKGTLHKNTAARRKGQLAALVAKSAELKEEKPATTKKASASKKTAKKA